MLDEARDILGTWRSRPNAGTEQHPARRKRRWPWVLAAVAGLILLLVAAGYLYNLHWQHKVDALLASYRAKGEPVTWEEVLAARNKLPAEQNSALIFQEAFPQLEAQAARPPTRLTRSCAPDEPGARPSQRTLNCCAPTSRTRRRSWPSSARGGAATGVLPRADSADPWRLRRCPTWRRCGGPSGSAPGGGASGAGRRRRGRGGEPGGRAPPLRVARGVLDAGRGDGAGVWDAITVGAMEKSLGLCQFPAEGLDRLREELAREESELSMRRALLGERAMGHYFFTRVTSVGPTPEHWLRPPMQRTLTFACGCTTSCPGCAARTRYFYYSCSTPTWPCRRPASA